MKFCKKLRLQFKKQNWKINNIHYINDHFIFYFYILSYIFELNSNKPTLATIITIRIDMRMWEFRFNFGSDFFLYLNYFER